MITIDPGLRGCGVACWRDNKLVSAKYIKNPCTTGRGYAVIAALAHEFEMCVGSFSSPAIIEHPRFYGSTHQKGDPNDLLDVMGVGAAISSFFWRYEISPESVFPSDWKGQVPKQKMLVRIWETLTDEERTVVQKTNKSDTEDIVDAIGIGLWKLNRLNKRKFAND